MFIGFLGPQGPPSFETHGLLTSTTLLEHEFPRSNIVENNNVYYIISLIFIFTFFEKLITYIFFSRKYLEIIFY